MKHALFRAGAPWAALILMSAPLLALAEPLTLQEVERLAGKDPAIERYRHQAESQREDAVAAGQLPDPQLSAELMQFPADRPGFSNDEMTQLQIGLQQTFPRGDSRRLSSERERAMARASDAQAGERERDIRREARAAYFDLLLEDQRLEVLRDSRSVFENLVEVTESSFASGTVSQQDVLRAELELERLEDRVDEAQRQREQARASLGRWIGDAAHRPLPDTDFPEMPDYEAWDLSNHPQLEASQARIQAEGHAIELAEQAYRPQWSFQLGYGLRTNSDVRNRHRLGAMVMVDLPLFTAQRQDRALAARQSEREAAVQERDAIHEDLERDLRALESDLERYERRENRYRDRLLEVAESNAEAAEKAYSAGTAEFTALMESRLLALETRLESLSLTAERKKVQADLLYLLGETEQ